MYLNVFHERKFGMKKLALLRLVVVFAMLLTAITIATSAHAAEPLRVTFVVNGTLGDKSFFDSAERNRQYFVRETLYIPVKTPFDPEYHHFFTVALSRAGD